MVTAKAAETTAETTTRKAARKPAKAAAAAAAGMLIGYARVSTLEQNLDLQKDALAKAGCQQTFEDRESGAKTERPGLAKVLEALRPGDTLVVWKLDRLGRSLKHLVETVQTLNAKGIGFKSLQESIDTTTSGGKLVFHVFAALAEFERDIIRERTQAGLAAARARGRQGGRPPGRDERKRAAAVALSQDENRSVVEICRMLGISRTSYYRYTGPASAPGNGPASSDTNGQESAAGRAANENNSSTQGTASAKKGKGRAAKTPVSGAKSA
jgi:DNA invertase Pin-like site-specific DNA recombinase